MSTKNFVSNGDMETLMSGIKDAIDGAGGGGTVTKTTVGEYTSGTFYTIGADLYSKLSALSNNILSKCYFEISGTGYTGTSKFYYNFMKLGFSFLEGIDFIFTKSMSANANMKISVSRNFMTIDQGGTSLSASANISDLNITKIGMYYDELEDAVVPSGETVVATANNSFASINCVTLLNNLYANIPNNLSTDIIKKLKLRILRDSTGTNFDIFNLAAFNGTIYGFIGLTDPGDNYPITIMLYSSSNMRANGSTISVNVNWKVELYYEN